MTGHQVCLVGPFAKHWRHRDSPDLLAQQSANVRGRPRQKGSECPCFPDVVVRAQHETHGFDERFAAPYQRVTSGAYN